MSSRELSAALLAGDRGALARSITLIESQKSSQAELAQELLLEILPKSGGAHRIGITGVPGAGKSTFIDALGTQLVSEGHRVAVLAVDPSSSVSGGSILGDKSRMPNLGKLPEAFIRPSPSALTLGGVARRTREAMLLCEAAGFDVVLVETVGVGQSETVVADMVDTFLLLALAGAGDELQGIKRGILELADLIVVNKCDGDNRARAVEAKGVYEAALRYLRPRSANWSPVAVGVSALTGEGLPELWRHLEAHRRALQESGDLEGRRLQQRRRWMWSLIDEKLLEEFRGHRRVASRLESLEREVVAGDRTPMQAADELLATFFGES